MANCPTDRRFANVATPGPVLLGVDSEPRSDDDGDSDRSDDAIEEDLSWKELPRHRDEDQVQLDVNRAFIYYPHGMCRGQGLNVKGGAPMLTVTKTSPTPNLNDGRPSYLV